MIRCLTHKVRDVVSFVCNVRFLLMFQVQEFRTGATRHNMETVHAKEETKRLRSQLTEIRDKLSELEARVSNTRNTVTTILRLG